jgi:predicted aldo/keto reductase-like oxidoreductase
MPAAVRWALKNKSVDTAIVCMTDFDQLDENFRTMSQPFTKSDEKLLSVQLASIRPLYCRMCGACSGTCSKGVPVADTLRYLTYAEGYGQFAMARQNFLELPENVRGIRCSDCDSCSVNCPNGVQVRQRLTRAQEIFA